MSGARREQETPGQQHNHFPRLSGTGYPEPRTLNPSLNPKALPSSASLRPVKWRHFSGAPSDRLASDPELMHAHRNHSLKRRACEDPP